MILIYLHLEKRNRKALRPVHVIIKETVEFFIFVPSPSMVSMN